MASLERVTAELASESDWWWGHTADLGWVVLDRQDVRNSGESRHLVRCSDWSTVVVTRAEFGLDRFVGFRSYISGLPTAEGDRAGDELLALRREFADRAASIRVTAADLDRLREEATLQRLREQEEADRRRQDAQRHALMTGDWITCADPEPMFDCLGQSVSTRKLRLFGIACYRRVWDLLTYQDCRRAILLIERLVEGEADPEEVHRIRAEMRGKWLAARQRGITGWRGKTRYDFLGAVQRLLQDGDGDAPDGTPSAELSVIWKAAAWARCWAHDRNITYYQKELKAQADLLREILGNPFRASTVAPGWLAWNDRTVVTVAQAIYGERRFEDLPILADALEEAGCDDETILAHCRSPGPHVWGCWVVDLLLGRE